MMDSSSGQKKRVVGGAAIVTMFVSEHMPVDLARIVWMYMREFRVPENHDITVRHNVKYMCTYIANGNKSASKTEIVAISGIVDCDPHLSIEYQACTNTPAKRSYDILFAGNEFCFRSVGGAECGTVMAVWDRLASEGKTIFSSKKHRAEMIQYLHERGGIGSEWDESINTIFDVLHEKWVAAMTTHW